MAPRVMSSPRSMIWYMGMVACAGELQSRQSALIIMIIGNILTS
jgi:hypothetical protein